MTIGARLAPPVNNELNGVTECVLQVFAYAVKSDLTACSCMYSQQGVRTNAEVIYNSALGVIFGVKKYADELLKVIDRKDIKVNFKRNLVEVNAVDKQAIFEVVDENRTETFPVSVLVHGQSGQEFRSGSD